MEMSLRPPLMKLERLVALRLGHARRRGWPRTSRSGGSLEGAQPEEVVLLLELLDRRSGGSGTVRRRRSSSVGVVLLAGHAVEAPVGVLVRCSRCRGSGCRNCWTARWWRGSVVRMKSSLEMSRPAQASANRGDSRSVHSWGLTPVLLGRPGHLLAVLVGPGEEEDVVADQPVPPGQGVGVDRGVGVPDVGRVVDVVDRRGDVVAGHCPVAYRPRPRPPTRAAGPSRATVYQLATWQPPRPVRSV